MTTTYEPTYTLFADFTDGSGDYTSHATWAEARDAMEATKANAKVIRSWLKLYPDVEEDFWIDEWVAPSIFNLD